ncbi:MAG: hypothetical protein ACI82S_000750, partial [Patiriisocius sp.]
MYNFTTLKNAKIADINGLVQTESPQNIILASGGELPAGTELSLAKGSEITLTFNDSTQQRIVAPIDETIDKLSVQTLPTSNETTDENPSLAQSPSDDLASNAQTDVDIIQQAIDPDSDQPVTPPGPVGAGTPIGVIDFITIDRDANETLAVAGYDTTGLAALPLTLEEPELLAQDPQPTDINNDVNTIQEDTTATGNVLDNDTDLDELLTVQSYSVAGDNVAYLAGETAVVEGGSLLISENGSYSFTPALDWNGVLPIITYTTNTDASAILTITVTPVNDAPVAQNDNFQVNEGETVTGNVITHNDGDGLIDTDGGDGADLSITQVNGTDVV